MHFTPDYLIDKARELNESCLMENDQMHQPWNVCFVSEFDWSLNFHDQQVVSYEDGLDDEDGFTSEVNKFICSMLLALAKQYSYDATIYEINQYSGLQESVKWVPIAVWPTSFPKCYSVGDKQFLYCEVAARLNDGNWFKALMTQDGRVLSSFGVFLRNDHSDVSEDVQSYMYIS